MKWVLDASAVLAVLQAERGQEEVLPHLRGGVISAVNYAEILKKSAEHGSPVERTCQVLDPFTLLVVPFDREQALVSASFWPAARQHGLSFADRACLALAQTRAAGILTADTPMSQAQVGIVVKHIRRG